MTCDGTAKRPAVLLLEDNAMTQGALVQVLEKHGYDVCAASTVVQGLECSDGKAYLILDMNLPDGVGLTVLQKARNEHPGIKTVVYSGSDDAALMDAVAEHHPDHVFRKPAMMGEIMGWLDAQNQPDFTEPGLFRVPAGQHVTASTRRWRSSAAPIKPTAGKYSSCGGWHARLGRQAWRADVRRLTGGLR
jgi:ActR/RegA family two-component response regulator